MVRLTVLNNMAGGEFRESFDRQAEWGIEVLDLKDALFGKAIEALSVEEAEQVAQAAHARGLSVHTMSTCLLHGDIEMGEAAFRERYRAGLDNLLKLAPALRPAQVRLLMAGTSRRADILDSSVYLEAVHPWVFDVYREAVDALADAGFKAVIENEVGKCLFSTPHEVIRFFSILARPGRVSLIWDVQNLWQMGTFPSLEVYEALKPVIGMLHVKGGRSEHPGGRLKWRSKLEDASWPVIPILEAAIADGKSDVICLNPSHGEAPEGYSHDFKADLDYLRASIKEIQ